MEDPHIRRPTTRTLLVPLRGGALPRQWPRWSVSLRQAWGCWRPSRLPEVWPWEVAEEEEEEEEEEVERHGDGIKTSCA